jgi:hypothetical protein
VRDRESQWAEATVPEGDGKGMPMSFDMRVAVPVDVLVQELAGESVLLDLKSERYFGLDDVGTRMWQVLRDGPSIQASYEQLLAEYDVDAEQLHKDLHEFIETLVEHGLLEICSP